MKKGLLGTKLGMTQIFSDDGRKIAVTVVKAGPCVVLCKKNVAKDGYNAIQLGFNEADTSRETRARIGHCKKAGKGVMKYMREFRIEECEQYSIGDILSADLFSSGEYIDVTGISIGKGYQGVIKRWNFQGGRSTHGSRFHRAPGSIGCSATPSRVLKNKKMPGQLGNSRITVQRLQVVRVDATDNLILVKGALPGPSNGLIMLRDSVKG
jgi:large subunit ribosomal protein L3